MFSRYLTIQLFFTILLTSTLTACGGGSSSDPVEEEIVITNEEVVTEEVTEESEAAFSGVPYDYVRYQNALDAANLQQTDDPSVDSSSKTDVVKAGGYVDYESEYFYIDGDTGNLSFEMSGDSNRTELRFAENFNSNLTNTEYVLSAELLPIYPADSVQNSTDGQEITVLQVHNKGTTGATDNTVLSHPLLRVVWDGESRTDDATGITYNNAYWGIVKTNAYECSNADGANYMENCPDSYDNVYLGDFVEGEMTQFDIGVGSNRLTINVDGIQRDFRDISYWSELYSYFKAGVYNQYNNGNSVVQFASVTFEEVTRNAALPVEEPIE